MPCVPALMEWRWGPKCRCSRATDVICVGMSRTNFDDVKRFGGVQGETRQNVRNSRRWLATRRGSQHSRSEVKVNEPQEPLAHVRHCLSAVPGMAHSLTANLISDFACLGVGGLADRSAFHLRS